MEAKYPILEWRMGYVSPVYQISGVHGWKKCFAPLPRTVYLTLVAPKAHFPSHAAIENGHVRDRPIDRYYLGCVGKWIGLFAT